MRISIQSGGEYLYVAQMEQAAAASATEGTKDTSSTTESTAAEGKTSQEMLKDFQTVLNKYIDEQRVAKGLDPIYSTNTVDTAMSYTDKGGDVTSVGIAVPDEYKSIFAEASQKYGVDQKLLEIIAARESNFNPTATSSAGAMGIMQLMPSTAEGLGVSNPYDAYQNIMGGANYIAQKLREYNGNVSLALAAYNAGSGNVAKYGGIPPFAETQNYVAWITERYNNALANA